MLFIHTGGLPAIFAYERAEGRLDCRRVRAAVAVDRPQSGKTMQVVVPRQQRAVGVEDLASAVAGAAGVQRAARARIGPVFSVIGCTMFTLISSVV